MIKKYEEFLNEGRFEEEGQEKLDRARQMSDIEYEKEINKSQRQAKILANEKKRQRLMDLVGVVPNLSKFMVDLLDALLDKYYTLKYKDIEIGKDYEFLLDEKIKNFPIETQEIINNINSIEELRIFLEDVSNLYPISDAELVMKKLGIQDTSDLYIRDYKELSGR
jgi:hypothetical protein